MSNAQHIQNKIDEIIAERKRNLPQISGSINSAKNQLNKIEKLKLKIEELSKLEKSDDASLEIKVATDKVDEIIKKINERIEIFELLKIRFDRDTINIGVAGEARVGKSTTLQKFSGLTEMQIPTGKLNPVTAVKSKIYNSDNNYALITFRDQISFIDEYIKPHLKIVNDNLKKRKQKSLIIEDMSSLSSINLPITLGSNPDSKATNSLQKIKEAQKSIATYSRYLIGETREYELKNIKEFVAYPSSEEISKEDQDDEIANRGYLAVKDIKIYCKFPAAGDSKVGLIDLPGLGEIGDTIDNLHLQGLENDVDQIFFIMRPDDSSSFVGDMEGNIVDQLRHIQPGIKHRGDLITAGANIFTSLENSDDVVKSLAASFEKNINGAQSEGEIEFLDYNAVDEESVSKLFINLLKKISINLPRMDKEVLDYAEGNIISSDDLSETLQNLSSTITKIAQKIPQSNEIINEQINKISSEIINNYYEYEVDLSKSASDDSEVYKLFTKDVVNIHDKIDKKIRDGFFKGRTEWEQDAKGKPDYYIYYREETRRVRREIIASYDELNKFYKVQVDGFKLQLINIFLNNTGRLKNILNINKDDVPNVRIDKILNELGGRISDNDFVEAMNLLKSVNFSFINNVYLQISEHLADLNNPVEQSEDYNKREELGGIGNDSNYMIELLNEFLVNDATNANDNIKDSLLECDDNFNEYLSICVSFFNDYLFRKDRESFKHVFIRSLINEYREYMPFDKVENTIEQDKKRCIDAIRTLIKELSSRESINFKSNINESPPKSEKRKRMNKFKIGQTINGKVKNIIKTGVFIDIGDVDGMIYSDQYKKINKKDISDNLKKGDIIRVRIKDLDFSKEHITLELA